MPHVGSVFLSSPISAARNSTPCLLFIKLGWQTWEEQDPWAPPAAGRRCGLSLFLRSSLHLERRLIIKDSGNFSSSWLLSPSFYFSSQLTAVVILSTWMGWHAFLPLKLSCFVNYFVRNLPGGLVVRTLHFHFRGWVQELRSCKSHDGAKKKVKKNDFVRKI